MCLFTPQLQVSPTRRAFRAMPSAERRRRTPHISRLQLPTNVSSEVAIIVPTHPLHFGKVVDLLRSTKRNVRSMHRVLTLLVVSSGNEKPQLARVLKQHSALYWWVRIVSLQEASACGYSLLAKREEGAFDLLAANGTGLGFDKFVLQSSKKTLGAMCVPQRHVLMLDSESLFVRRVDLEAEVRALGSAEAWPILYDAPSAGSAAWQNAGSTTRIAAASLVAEVAKRLCARAVGGLRCEPWDSSAETGRMYGFSLGYFWLFPTAVVRGFVGALRRAYGSYWRAMEAVGARPGKWFGELALYVFMLHVHTGRRRYAAVDAQGLLRRHVPDRAPPRRTLSLALALSFHPDPKSNPNQLRATSPSIFGAISCRSMSTACAACTAPNPNPSPSPDPNPNSDPNPNNSPNSSPDPNPSLNPNPNPDQVQRQAHARRDARMARQARSRLGRRLGRVDVWQGKAPHTLRATAAVHAHLPG